MPSEFHKNREIRQHSIVSSTMKARNCIVNTQFKMFACFSMCKEKELKKRMHKVGLCLHSRLSSF